MKISVKKLLIFFIYFSILLFILLFTLYLYKAYAPKKYTNYDEIISVSNNTDFEVVFYNFRDEMVGINYYDLELSTNKVGEDILVRSYNKSDEISYTKFSIILDKISDLANTSYILNEYNIIRYGGEKVIISQEDFQILLDYINYIDILKDLSNY